MIIKNYAIQLCLFINTIFIIYNDYNQKLLLENLFNKNKDLIDISLNKLKNLQDKLTEYHFSVEQLLLKEKLQEGMDCFFDSYLYSVLEHIALTIICAYGFAFIVIGVSFLGHRYFGWDFDDFFKGNGQPPPPPGAGIVASSAENTFYNDNHFTLSPNVTNETVHISRERLYEIIPAHLRSFTLHDYARLTRENMQFILGPDVLFNPSIRQAFIQDLIAKEYINSRALKILDSISSEID